MHHDDLEPDRSGHDEVVLHRAFGHLAAPQLSTIALDDAGAADLSRRLRSLGWSSVDRETDDPVHLLIANDGQLDQVSALALVRAPVSIAVHGREAAALLTWPVWDAPLVDIGYLPCLFTGEWRIYVSPDGAEEFGPRLSFPPLAEELPSPASPTRAELVAEVVRWRTAALSRWTVRTAPQGSGLDSAAEREVARLRAALADTQATVSWRITRPLRAIQSRRLRGAQQ